MDMPADEADRLSGAARRLYGYAAERHAFTEEEAAELLGDPAAVSTAIAELTAAHLLQPRPDGAEDCLGIGPTRWSAVSPRAATARTLAPLALRMRETHDEMDRLRTLLETLIPQYEAGTSQRDRDGVDHLEMITDQDALRDLLQGFAASAECEMLTCHPGGGRPAEILAEAVLRDEALLTRGVRLRTIYQHTARYSPPTAAYVERVTALGSQVRTVGDGLMRMILVDRHTGLMEVQGDTKAALLVREPNVVHFMVQTFERSWAAAEPFTTTIGPEQARSISEELRQTIVRLLAEGMEDKIIARRLGMSERTCQRHIAEIMRAVGAKSRFQAGYLLAAAITPTPLVPPVTPPAGAPEVPGAPG